MDAKRTCSVDDCGRDHYARGWCKRHYSRAWVNGGHTSSPRSLVPPGASLETRLRHTGWDVSEVGCWEWKGSLNTHGYGQLADGSGAPAQAHRAAFEVFHGIAPGASDVCHSCDNRQCINPDHLFLGSRRDNLQDMSKKERNATGEYRPDFKITGAQVDEIRLAYDLGGRSQKNIAAEYGVSQQLISSIVRGERRVKASRAGAALSPKS